jgi:pimeloyl-ACP methyl ester carboxylesterase
MKPSPFQVSIAEEKLIDLESRLRRTRWPAVVGEDGWAFGVPVAYMRELTDHWIDGFDWREQERAMNQLPQFTVEIDSTPIHFVHQKGVGPDPTPLLLTHGWPWSVWDFQKVIGPLTDPAAHGGNPADAFDVVAPSLPGYGFSSPLARGVNIADTADLWLRLMRDVLGYDRFVAQGGDWGALVSGHLGHAYADDVLAVHLSIPNVLSINWRALTRDDYPGEEHLYDKMQERLVHTSHLGVHTTDPQTLAFALEDSPVGLAAWMIDRRRNWSDCGGDVESVFDRDHLLMTATLYWATGTIASSMRFYWEAAHRRWAPAHDRLPVIEAPTAVARFPEDLIFAPRRLAEERANLQRWTEMPRGGHFAHMEAPDLLVEDLRDFVRPLRSGAPGNVG